MKMKLFVLTLCLLTTFSAFTQSTSQTTESCKDTLYSVSATQLRATARIFAEHSFLKSENALLHERISLLERSGTAKDYIIQSQRDQINTLNEIIVRKDAMLKNSEAMIENMKRQVKAEQKDMRKFWYGVGAGIAVSGVAVLILK